MLSSHQNLGFRWEQSSKVYFGRVDCLVAEMVPSHKNYWPKLTIPRTMK